MRRAYAVLILLLLASAQTLARGARGCETEMCGLVIRGEVTGLEVEKERNAVFFDVKLNVEFRNEGAEPVILFAPEFAEADDPESSGYWLGGWSLYATEEDAKAWKPIFGDGYWQSVSRGDEYRVLAEKLDVKTPPDEYTRTLRPGEVWKSPDSFRIYFEAEKHDRYPRLATWKEMQEFPARLWLRIDYELSPWNVEIFRPGLIRKLKKRWAAYGNVLVEEKKEGDVDLFRAESEPMQIDFSQAKEIAPKSVQE